MVTYPILDYRSQLAALPRKAKALPQNAPLKPTSITFHYSGVRYTDRRPAAERARVFAEARDHLTRNWRAKPKPGEPVKPPIWATRYQYHFVVLTDGTVVVCNDLVQLWHCGNATGNGTSIAVHVMLGPNQAMTEQQHTAVIALFDTLRQAHGIARSAVYGHNEWPRGDGAAQPSPVYRVMPPQSECPGALLHKAVAAYREGPYSEDSSIFVPLRYRARYRCDVRPEPNDDIDRTGTMLPGFPFLVDAIVTGKRIERNGVVSDQWARLRSRGYIWLPQLEAV